MKADVGALHHGPPRPVFLYASRFYGNTALFEAQLPDSQGISCEQRRIIMY